MAASKTSKPQKSKRGGSRPGAGRKPQHVEADLQVLMDKAWPQASREAVIAALHEKAMAGSVQAAVALLDRALGKPIERQIVDREASDELRIRVEYSDPEPKSDE